MLTNHSDYDDQSNSSRPAKTTSRQPDTNYDNGPSHSSRSTIYGPSTTDFTCKKNSPLTTENLTLSPTITFLMKFDFYTTRANHVIAHLLAIIPSKFKWALGSHDITIQRLPPARRTTPKSTPPVLEHKGELLDVLWKDCQSGNWEGWEVNSFGHVYNQRREGRWCLSLGIFLPS